MMKNEKSQLEPVIDTQLIEDVGDMVFNGLFTNRKLFGNFFISLAGHNRLNDVHLSRGEPVVIPDMVLV